MIAYLISEFSVNVDHVVVEQAGKQTVAQQNVVQVLRVAFKNIRIPLALRQCFHQGVQDAALQGVKRV